MKKSTIVSSAKAITKSNPGYVLVAARQYVLWLFLWANFSFAVFTDNSWCLSCCISCRRICDSHFKTFERKDWMAWWQPFPSKQKTIYSIYFPDARDFPLPYAYPLIGHSYVDVAFATFWVGLDIYGGCLLLSLINLVTADRQANWDKQSCTVKISLSSLKRQGCKDVIFFLPSCLDAYKVPWESLRPQKIF